MANILTNKLGPLPTWGWLGIITGGGITYYLYEKNKAGSSATPTTGAGQIPDYIFQNYNQLPPGAPAPTTSSSGGGKGKHTGGKGKHPVPGKAPDTDHNKDETTAHHAAAGGHHAQHSSGLRRITPAQARALIHSGHKAMIRRRHGKAYVTGADYQKAFGHHGHSHPGLVNPGGRMAVPTGG